MNDWEMVFYGTGVLPSDQSPDLNFKSGECRVSTTKCLGLLLILSAIIIPGSF